MWKRALASWFATLAMANPGVAQVELKPGDEYIEIDGAKNPELIPAWQVWETTFQALALAKRNDSVAIPESLHMSQADQVLVFAEAKAQSERDRRCQEKVETLRPLIGKVETKTIWEKNWDIVIECRQATLDAAQQLMGRLSPEGQTSLLAWTEERKRHMSARVPKSELAHYRRPY